MSGTGNTTFTVGDKYWCVSSGLSAPLLGTIIVLTDNPGKRIGLQFDEEIGKRLTCDGAGLFNQCLWVHPDFIYDEDEWVAVDQSVSLQKATVAAMVGKKFNSITLDEDGQFSVDSSEPKPLALEDGEPVLPSFKE
jgi:hypothetical protein